MDFDFRGKESSCFDFDSWIFYKTLPHNASIIGYFSDKLNQVKTDTIQKPDKYCANSP